MHQQKLGDSARPAGTARPRRYPVTEECIGMRGIGFANSGLGGRHNGQSRPYAIHSEGECDRLERQAMLAGLKEHLARLSGLPRLTSILDVGCDSGSMTRLLAAKRPDAQVVGVDLRSDARERVRGERLDNPRFEQGDISNLQFRDGAFDLVWSKYVLQWLKDPAPAVAELRRVTAPGGSVICSSFDGFAVTHWPEDPMVQGDT